MRRYLEKRLANRQGAFFALFATLSAFLLYSCMYAFRKPYTAAEFIGYPELLGFSYKETLVLAQICGYAISKFLGIRIISSQNKSRRARSVIGLISLSWVALLAFALLPPEAAFIAMIGNGMALGMIWGIVFSYLEGRRNTELLGLGLCASFVLSGGVVKDIGVWLMDKGISEMWMPFTTGALFFIPMIVLALALDFLPEPDASDIQQRSFRPAMTSSDRRGFLHRYRAGVWSLVLVYMLLSSYRTFRDDFMADIWADLRLPADIPAFSRTEIPVAVGVLLILAPTVLLKSNRSALQTNLLAILVGVLTCGAATLAFRAGMISDYVWMLSLGIGSYLAYIPYNAILFDRLIAYVRKPANAGFLIYLADAFGYAASVVLVAFNGQIPELNYALTLERVSLALGILGSIGLLFAARYFLLRSNLQSKN